MGDPISNLFELRVSYSWVATPNQTLSCYYNNNFLNMKPPITLESIKPELLAFLTQHQLMSIATFRNELWIATVYYAVDDQLHFYFVSSADKIHSQHILQNPQVAIAINDSQQTPQKMEKFVKCGVQISGHASLLEEPKEIEDGLRLWKKALKIQSNEYFSVERILTHAIPQKVWRVTPHTLRFFHEKLFDEDETPLFQLE